MQGHDDEVERVVADVWDDRSPTPSRAPPRRAARRHPLLRRDATSTARSPPTRRRATGSTDPEDDRRRRRPPGDPAGRCRAGRPRRCASPTPSASLRSAATQVELTAARAIEPARRRAVRRGRRAVAPSGGRPRRPAGLARPTRHRPAPRQRGPRARLLRALRARPAQLLEPAAERARATNAMGAWVWFEMALAEIARDTGRGHEAIRRFRAVAEMAPPVGPGRRAGLGPRRRRPGPSAARRVRARRRRLSQRADDVGDSPVATSFATRERTRAWLDACRGDLVAARRTHPRASPSCPDRDQVYIFETGVLHDLVRLGVAGGGRRPAGRARRLRRRSARCTSTPPTPRRRSSATSTRYDDVVDRYEALDALGHRRRGGGRAGRPAPRRRRRAAPSRRRPAALGGPRRLGPAGCARRCWPRGTASSR